VVYLICIYTGRVNLKEGKSEHGRDPLYRYRRAGAPNAGPAEHAGIEVAKRFRAAVERTYEELAYAPRIGSAQKLREGRHAGIRLWPVRDFGNYWIACHPHRVGVAIERLFHAKQDYSRVFGK
jgi:plasmid stabilization system protein ParE